MSDEMKTERRHNVNFVVAGDIVGCHNDSLWYH